jgi:hypothetical protein
MGFFGNFGKRRLQEMEFVATKLNSSFRLKDDFGLRNMLMDFKLFRTGGSKGITNIIWNKSEELEWYVFDYKYVISTGNSARRISQTVFFMDSKKLGLPEFSMKPENLLHRIGTWLGWDDIDFMEYPKFSDQYFLKGENESFIRKSFDEGVLKLFSIEKGWWMEGLGYYLILYKKNKKLKTYQIVDFHKKMLYLYDLFKNDKDEFYTEKEEDAPEEI